MEPPTKDDIEKLGVYTNADGVVVIPLSFEDEQDVPAAQKCKSCPCNIGCKVWCKKYFWEGQVVTEEQQQAMDDLDPDAPFTEKILVKYRKQVGILIPLILYHFWWWSVMIKFNLWKNFTDKYFMTLVMIVGGFVAGGTTEGGGAVAFPTMTLAFGIAPTIARDFSLLIQASGMSAASFVILFMRVKVIWHAIVYCTIGGLLGSIPGLYWLDPYLPPAWKKMFFSCVWFSFACSLLILNWKSKRLTYDEIKRMTKWKALVLFIGGFVGGVFTSITGTGLDICTFSVLTIIFRVSEKIATPTAVCLMAWNSILTAAWRHVMMEGIATETWEFLSVTFQVVTVMAPIGAIVSTHMHRQVLAAFVYILDFAALIGAFVILPMTVPLATGSVAIIIACGFIFFGLTKLGGVMQDRHERQRRQSVYVERRKSLGLLNPDDISRFTSGGVDNKGYVSNGVSPQDGYVRNGGASQDSYVSNGVAPQDEIVKENGATRISKM